MNINDRLKVSVLALLAFSFLGFYIWFSYLGLDVLSYCKLLGPNDVIEGTKCGTKGGSVANSLDFFFAVSGVVSAVAMTALGHKPDAPANVVSVLRGTVRFDTSKLVDIMIAAYLLIWVIVGLIVCAKTATLMLEEARKWKLEWLRDAGRTWWPAALTAVALWMGVPVKNSGTSGSTGGAAAPTPHHLNTHGKTEMALNLSLIHI